MPTNSKQRSELQTQVDDRLIERLATTLLDARRNCITCEFFNMSSEICSLAQKRPPAKVIVFGCENYSQFPF